MAHARSAVKPLVAAVLAASTIHTPLTSAQERVLEEIIVTSQLRAESLQDVPVSVNAVSGDKMMSAGITKIEDLQAYVPNLTMSETGIGTNIYIRGIGSGINQGFEQSVGMYVDGVSYGRAQLSRAPFLDLARVEVLRGPQNILFGKNSIAGALSAHTNKPGEEFEGMVSALYEPEYGEEVYDVVLSGPITSTFGARLAYRNRATDGYVENIQLGGDEPEREEETIRLTLDFQPTDDLGMTLKYETGDFDVTGRQIEIVNERPAAAGTYAGVTYAQVLASGGGFFTPQDASVLNNTQDFRRSSNASYNSDKSDYSNNSTENITLTVDYALGEHTLTFIGAHMAYDYDELCDCDFTGADFFSSSYNEEYEQTSAEFRLASPVGQTIEYIGGVYYQDSEIDYEENAYFPSSSVLVDLVNAVSPLGNFVADTSGPRTFDQEAEMYAIFAQATWNITDDLRLTVGGRYSDEEKKASRTLGNAFIDGSPIDDVTPIAGPFTRKDLTSAAHLAAFNSWSHELSGERDEDNFSPLVTGEWDVSDDVMTYLTFTQGSKAGGFDVRSNSIPNATGSEPITSIPIPEGTFEYEDEQATSYELGAKTTWLDGAAELNVALFFTEYEDLQVSEFDGRVGFNVTNAAKAETMGLELDGRWLLTDSLILSGAIAFLDFEFKDYPNAQCYIEETGANAQGLCDRSGATNQYVADWSGYLSLDHVLPLGAVELRTGVDMLFSDDYNPSQTLDPAVEQDAYYKFNLRVALADVENIWEVALVAKNVTDEVIMTYAGATPLAYSSFGTPSYYAFYEPERTVAIQGIFRF